MIASTFPTSEEDATPRFVFDLAKEISTLGHDVKVLAPYKSDCKMKDAVGRIQVERFHYFLPKRLQMLCEGSGIPPNIHKGIFVKFQLLTYVLTSTIKKLSMNDADVIHVHWPLPNAIPAILSKKLYGIPFVNTIYGAEVYLSEKFHAGSLLKSLVNESEKSIAISHGTYRACLSHGLDANKLEIIPLGVDTSLFKPIDINRDGSVFQVISVGRLVERKGFDYLIKAISEVRDECREIKVKIVGSGPRKQILQAQIKNHGLEKIVSLTGPRSHEDLAKLYNQSDLFILPSIVDSKGDTEGLGVVLLEAMACKLPVIGTNVGGIPDIIEHDHNGIIVPEKNSSKLAEAILEMFHGEKKRERLSKNGYETARRNFSWQGIAKKYIRVYTGHACTHFIGDGS